MHSYFDSYLHTNKIALPKLSRRFAAFLIPLLLVACMCTMTESFALENHDQSGTIADVVDIDPETNHVTQRRTMMGTPRRSLRTFLIIL